MPRGRPPTTGTGHQGPRVRVSPETLARLQALATHDETMPMVLARVVADAYAAMLAADKALTPSAASSPRSPGAPDVAPPGA